jgi:hypothetical protein
MLLVRSNGPDARRRLSDEALGSGDDANLPVPGSPWTWLCGCVAARVRHDNLIQSAAPWWIGELHERESVMLDKYIDERYIQTAELAAACRVQASRAQPVGGPKP